MSENLFIKKRQKERRKHTFLTVKLIMRLVFASALLLLGFHFFVGDPTDGLCAAGCESEYSLATYVYAALIMLGAVIVLGGLTGALFAYLRRNRQSDGMFTLLEQQETDENN